MPTNTRDVLARTASYTVTVADEGLLITNRGATGAITITTPNAPPTGFWFEVAAVAAQTLTVASDPVDTLIVFNDATARTLAWSTAGAIIGNSARLIYDGTGWIVQLFPCASDLATPLFARTVLTT